MTVRPLHRWDLTPQEAIAVQAALRQELKLAWDNRPVSRVAGVDVSVGAERARAAIVILEFPELTPIEAVVAEAELTFPYIPGLLAFREGPAVLSALEKLQTKPDLLMFDGQGIAHPRGIGIASQMGLWLERPTIGVAKSRLYGCYLEPASHSGAVTELRDEGESSQVIGMVLRTREGSKPLFISPGHLINLPHALDFVLRCCQGYRLPEPTRWAHRVAGGEALPVQSARQGRLF